VLLNESCHLLLPQFSLGGEVINRVSEFTHLGHIISDKLDDKVNVITCAVRLIMCCVIFVHPLIKLKLFRMYCSDFYGSLIWDLSTHPSVENVCIAWRKRLKRVWELPTRTHSALVAPLCGVLPLKYELTCRSAAFIVKCLNSCNSIVRSVTRQGVYFQRMHSFIGRNAQYCASLFGVSFDNLSAVNKRSTWSYLCHIWSGPDFSSLGLIANYCVLSINILSCQGFTSINLIH